MLSPSSSEEALRRLFRRQPVNELADLFRVLKTTSRMSVFRRLKVLGYLSSFTHGGRFYTLEELAHFDQWGLWFYRDVGFSRAGTLKATVVELVEGSIGGMTPKELVALLKHPVPGSLYNTLRELVGSGRLRRQRETGLRLYLSVDAVRAEEQLAERRRKTACRQPPPAQVPTETVIAVLVETLQVADAAVAAPVVVDHLKARGVDVTALQVEQVFAHYGLGPGKKKEASDSRPSKSSEH